jgi:hypothetical protein
MAFRCHAPTMLEPFAPYRRLRDVLAFVSEQDGNGLSYLSGRPFLLIWRPGICWPGAVKACAAPGQVIPQLMAKGGNFSLADRQSLLAELSSAVAGLIPRYRALAESGQVELSCTPATHPLAPLMIDFSSPAKPGRIAPARRP